MQNKRQGRKARADKRAEEKPSVVWPGMAGGQYKPLQESELPKIHEAALDMLERTGVSNIWPQYQDFFKAAGGWLNDAGRVCLPKALVEDCIEITRL